MQKLIKVALLSKDSIVLEGLRRILANKNFKVTQSVSDDTQLLEGQGNDLLIVVDGAVPTNNTDMIRTLRRRFPTVKLIVLSDGFKFEAMALAFRAGVHGYIPRDISSGSLVGSLRLIAMGEKVMPSCLVDALGRPDEYELDHARDLLETANLSAREREILRWLISGSPDKVISRQLAIAEATVKVHVKAILRKLKVQNRTQAAVRGMNGGLEHRLPSSLNRAA